MKGRSKVKSVGINLMVKLNQTQRTTVVQATNSLDVRLGHFLPLTHRLLHFLVGDDGGQTVGREETADTKIKVGQFKKI